MRKLTKTEFIEKAVAVHGDKYNYDKVEYVNGTVKVSIVCHSHGVFAQRPNDHLSGYGCVLCRNDMLREKFQYTTEKFVESAIAVHGDKYDYSITNYTTANDKVKITCTEHGIFEQRANAHISGQGCPQCGDEQIAKQKSSNKEEFVQKAIQCHGNKYNYDEVVYIRSHLKVKIGCVEHGYFNQSPNNHLNKKAGCPLCNSSKGELRISEILDKHKIKYIREYKIPNTNARFEYDFYLPDYHLLIEFQGIQHYEPVDYFGGEESLKYVQRNDVFKKALAREVKVKMIEFNYRQLKYLSEEEFEKLVLKHVMFGMPSIAEMDEYID